MGMDELEDPKGSAPAGENQSSQPGPPPAADADDDKGSRVDAAKAFFRAMYAGDEPPASFGQPQAESATQTACRNCEALTSSLKDAEQKQAEAETLYKRMAADFDNYRRRMEREREESISIGVKKAAEGMLPALDDLDRAMQFLNPDTPGDKLIDGFKLVQNRIMACMEGVGLKPIEAVGQPFDPRFHEPVQQIETTEHPDGNVMQELRRGYTIGDKVVRPSLVNVASNSTGVVKPAAAAADTGAEPAGTGGEPAITLDSASSSADALADKAIEAELERTKVSTPEEPQTNERVFELEDIPEA